MKKSRYCLSCGPETCFSFDFALVNESLLTAVPHPFDSLFVNMLNLKKITTVSCLIRNSLHVEVSVEDDRILHSLFCAQKNIIVCAHACLSFRPTVNVPVSFCQKC